MNHIHKAKQHFTPLKKIFTISLGILSMFLVLIIGAFALTRETTPYVSELAIVGHSVLGISAGSVIPASGESSPTPDPTPPADPTPPVTPPADPTPPPVFDICDWFPSWCVATPPPTSTPPPTPTPTYESYETYPANPLVTGLMLTGNRTPNGTISFSCSDSPNYSITRTEGATGIFPVSKAYTGPVSVGVTAAGNYTVRCTNQDLSDAKIVAYNPKPIIPTDLSLTATPRSIIAGAKVTLQWGITDPNNSCRIIVSPICTGACDVAHTAAAVTLQSTLDTGATDSNDPYGASRPMASAIQTSYTAGDTKAQGKKTVHMQYSADYKLQCGTAVASTTVRVIVTSTNEG